MTGQEKKASSCTREDLDSLSSIGADCPEKQWNHHLWRYLNAWGTWGHGLAEDWAVLGLMFGLDDL